MSKRVASDRYAAHVLGLMLLGGSLIGVSSSDVLPKKIIWNASASVSVGLYFVQDRDPVRGDLVLVRFPDWVALIASQRDYLFPNLPAIKKVAALTGDTVCRLEESITINGVSVTTAHRRDGWGRKMPLWSGCRMLIEGEVFLLNDHAESFDGRYFGVTEVKDIIGVARPIWQRSKFSGIGPLNGGVWMEVRTKSGVGRAR